MEGQMKFSTWIERREISEGLLGMAKNMLGIKKREPGVPYDGDPLTVYYLYNQNGTKLLSSHDEGTLRIAKDGSVLIQHEMGNATKLAKSVQQAGLQPNGNRGWKIERMMS